MSKTALILIAQGTEEIELCVMISDVLSTVLNADLYLAL